MRLSYVFCSIYELVSSVDSCFLFFQLPTANLSVSLEEYTDLCLSLADIPVHSSRIEALHLLFTLYAEIKSSQHYRNMAANNGYDDAASEVNRLELSD